MIVFIVLVSVLDQAIEPWGVFSTRKLALEAQTECRKVYAGQKTGSIFGLESCEIWKYTVDDYQQEYSPRSDFE